MANTRLSKEKRVFFLGALCEGTPINAVCRMFGVGKNTVLRIVEETGEAMADYMTTISAICGWIGWRLMKRGRMSASTAFG
jgi:hypothetical protein